jgi:hypothetical protein
MASRYAVNRIEPRGSRPTIRTGWYRDLEIDATLPVVRRGKLARHSPLLKKRQTARAAKILKDLWPEWQHEYVAKMAEIAGINPRDLAVAENEIVRYRMDGDTPMIDLPRIRTTHGGSYQFDQRNCVALCIEPYSSKIWSRIGLPDHHAGAALKDVRALTNRFRRHADEATEWFYEEFFRLTADAYKGTRRIRDNAVLEVTTVGLRFEGDFQQDDLDAWLFADDTANLANPALRDLIAAAANVDFDIAELEEDAYWLPVPTALDSRNRKVVPRRVLYLSRTVGDVVQFVGVGLDDSSLGELANDVGLKLARMIAGWV